MIYPELDLAKFASSVEQNQNLFIFLSESLTGTISNICTKLKNWIEYSQPKTDEEISKFLEVDVPDVSPVGEC